DLQDIESGDWLTGFVRAPLSHGSGFELIEVEDYDNPEIRELRRYFQLSIQLFASNKDYSVALLPLEEPELLVVPNSPTDRPRRVRLRFEDVELRPNVPVLSEELNAERLVSALNRFGSAQASPIAFVALGEEFYVVYQELLDRGMRRLLLKVDVKTGRLSHSLQLVGAGAQEGSIIVAPSQDLWAIFQKGRIVSFGDAENKSIVTFSSF
ncbi:MAG: hypothetical protein AAGD38_21365, partial [Acidobacteriota bacterium]